MESVIFTLSYEKRWDCYLIFAYEAEETLEYYRLGGRFVGGRSPELDMIIAKIMKYDTQELYRLFGKKKYKNEREFLEKVDEEYCREFIRPHIGKYLALVLECLAEKKIPVYLKTDRLNNLYERDRLVFGNLELQPTFRFVRSEENTRYILKGSDGSHEFYPSDQRMIVLITQPCWVVYGNQLCRFFPGFDGIRLKPFLTKREVVIPKASEKEYFRKFILKNLLHAGIEVEGFEVISREVVPVAQLSLECDLLSNPVLVLYFIYEQKRISPDYLSASFVSLKSEGDLYAFYKTNRNKDWEAERLENLRLLRLTEKAKGCFLPCGEDQSISGLIDWIRQNRECIETAGFVFTSEYSRISYYTGKYTLSWSMREEVDWFGISAFVELEDGRKIPFAFFKEHILSGEREYSLDDGTVFIIPDEWFARYTDILLFARLESEELYLNRNQYVLVNPENVEPVICDSDPVVHAPMPQGFAAELRPYQQKGYEWIYERYRKGFGACLADDMGLGKTVQAICMLLQYRQENGFGIPKKQMPFAGSQLKLFDVAGEENTDGGEFRPCLVIVPASLAYNWKRELKRFAPQLRVMLYAGSARMAQRDYLSEMDVVILTYQTMRNDIDYLASLSFGLVVLDEAQMCKNPDSQIHQAVLQIPGHCFLALSGTPVENSLSDLWSVMHIVNRGVLGSHRFFREYFVKPITSDLTGLKSDALKKLITPFMLRRTKEEVLNDLPECVETIHYCEPEPEQKRFYEEERARVRNYILEKEEKCESLRNDFAVLQALMRLRQIVNHPQLVDPGYTDSSGKFDEIFRMLEEVVSSGHKVLLFSSFVKYLNLIADQVGKREWQYVMLTGATVQREREIEKFSTNPECRIFLISLKAGGVGLNLTEADYVFILDPWWNLSVENQAIGRAHRMGQTNTVFVYRFICEGTLEEKILSIQQKKQRIADKFVTSDDSPDLDAEELKMLLE